MSSLDLDHPPPRLRRHLLLVLLAASALLGSAAGAAPAGSCADCCQLPCIEARMWQATFMKGFYKKLSKTRGLSVERYLEREADAKQLSEAVSSIYLGANPACAWYTPEPNSMEARDLLNNTGFGLRGEGKYLSWNFTVQVDLEKCEVTKPRALELMPKITSCDGIGNSVVAHEQKHVADCQAHKKKGGKALTPAQNAAREVAGYEAEIAELKKARLESAKKCTDGSCKTSQMQFDRAARQFHTDILALVGKGPKKPPSKSPLARARKGN
ncbi:MAG TPA: hypothetical protein VLA66_09620 [Thermoanaerobaculia bacterium]|nr:hypothetical protein [Thermoanaerobaculia bacterium]